MIGGDFCPIVIDDEHDLDVAHAEIRRRLLPWLVESVVRMLIEAGVTREKMEPLAMQLVERAYPLLTAAYARRADEIRSSLQVEDDAPLEPALPRH